MLPIQVAWMIADFGSPAAQDARALKFLFHVGDLSLCFHACVDPWIYGIFAKQFRQDYIDCCYTFICCCFRRYRPVPQQNELLTLGPQWYFRPGNLWFQWAVIYFINDTQIRSTFNTPKIYQRHFWLTKSSSEIHKALTRSSSEWRIYASNWNY